MDKYLKEKKLSFPKLQDAPIWTNYKADIDEREELDVVDTAYFQSLIYIYRK